MQKGHADSWEVLRNDLDNFVKFVKEKEPKLPVILFGNSMGGLLTIDYLQHQNNADSFPAAIVNSPALAFHDINSVSAFGIKALKVVASSLQINAGLDSKKLTRDPELQKENDEGTKLLSQKLTIQTNLYIVM